MKKMGALLLGENGDKGALKRSGIAAALVTTVFVILDGYIKGDIGKEILNNRTALQPLWLTAITMWLTSKSKK